MATIPTPAEVARAILDQFKSTEARPGHVLMRNNIVGLQASRGFTGDEMMAGLQYGGDQGWIENGPNNSIRLTDAGFAAM